MAEIMGVDSMLERPEVPKNKLDNVNVAISELEMAVQGEADSATSEADRTTLLNAEGEIFNIHSQLEHELDPLRLVDPRSNFVGITFEKTGNDEIDAKLDEIVIALNKVLQSFTNIVKEKYFNAYSQLSSVGPTRFHDAMLAEFNKMPEYKNLSQISKEMGDLFTRMMAPKSAARPESEESSQTSDSTDQIDTSEEELPKAA